jgi:glycosyltransferase involved in cell wall biosynthesis
MKPVFSEFEASALQGYHILFLSLPKHDGAYTSTPWQIATQLAKTNKVIFADHPFTFSDLLTGFFKRSIRKRIMALWQGTSFEKDGVNVLFTPFVWPVNFLPKGKLYNFFSAWNHRLVATSVNKYLKQNGIDALIYINSFDFYFPYLHQYLNAHIRLQVYHCIDPMIKPFTLKHGLYLQDRAAKEADLIICTAPALQKDFLNKGFYNTHLVPNAANFKLFSSALKTNAEIPLEEKIQGKVIGYLGNIERRIDFGLLQKVLNLLPEWHLVLAGPVERQYVPVEFFNHKRVHFLGTIAHSAAPALVKRFDVAIIPFKRDEVSQGIYPLKLFEYMAAGRPVVTTNFNPDILADLCEVLHAADSPEQFADFVLLAYATDSVSKKERRVGVASENTWEHRAQLFKSIISIELKNKYFHVS